jgi:hypothetical protein
MKMLFRAYFHQKNFLTKLAENLLGSGSGSGSGAGSGSGRFRKSDPDPVKNRLYTVLYCIVIADRVETNISDHKECFAAKCFTKTKELNVKQITVMS